MKKEILIIGTLLLLTALCGCVSSSTVYTVTGTLKEVEPYDGSGLFDREYTIRLDTNGTTVLSFDNEDVFDWESELKTNYIDKEIEVTVIERGNYRYILSVKEV